MTMNKYIQKLPDGGYRELNNTPIEWDATHYCRPSALTLAEAADFRVYPLHETPQPEHDPQTQRVERDGVVCVDGQWHTAWRVVDLSPAELLTAAKAARADQIAAITVTTAGGNVFDGDEKSQDRMSRALAAMDDADTLPWVLADNSVAVVGRSELREALRLAGAEMAAIWVGVYTGGQ